MNDNGTPGFTGDDRIVYAPPTDFIGTKSITYKVFDGHGHTTSGTIKISVAPHGLYLGVQRRPQAP